MNQKGAKNGQTGYAYRIGAAESRSPSIANIIHRNLCWRSWFKRYGVIDHYLKAASNPDLPPMRMILRTLTSLLVAGACAVTCVVRAGDVSRGIYSLGAGRDNPNTAQDERLAGIRDYDFVSGFTMRVFWTDIESTEGNYDFSVIDAAIQSVAALGQGFSLEVLNGEEPAYVLNGASATYIDHRGGTNPVPWDSFAQERMAALRSALANHLVPGPGGPRPLSADPTLRSIDSSPVGLNFGVRDLNSGIRNHPDYTQQRYIDAIVAGVADSAAAFPNDTNFLAFFGFTDGQPGTPVDKQIIQRLAPLYNGPGETKLDFFVENLSDDGPVPLGNGSGPGNHLVDWVNAGGDSMVQALDSWLQHQPDREPQLDSHNPATGIQLIFNTYGTRFVELYTTDLDGANGGALDAAGRPLIVDLREWSRTLSAAITVPGDYSANGTVDAADYVIWRDRLGGSVQMPNDDTPGVDTSDYERWRANFGQSTGAGQLTVTYTSIPEPATLLMFCAGLAGRLRWHRTRLDDVGSHRNLSSQSRNRRKTGGRKAGGSHLACRS
jgi:hypothetical protein